MAGSITKPQSSRNAGLEAVGGVAGSRELLASEEGVTAVSITLSSAARDNGNSPNTDLRMGLLLSKDSTTGKYREFHDGEEDSAVVLPEPVRGIDTMGNFVVHAYDSGFFKADSIIIPSASNPNFALMQRLRRRTTDQ